MAMMERIGHDEVSDRELFVFDINLPEEIPEKLELDGQFVGFLAWDATHFTDVIVKTLAGKLLAAGCAYICCWGPGCERVHDIFDDVDLEGNPDGPYITSTWHSDESLTDAIWYSLFNAYPDPVFFDSCRATVAISIGSSTWAAEIRSAFKNPSRFSQMVTG